ncbi:glycoside hydrolase family protein (plasmid) [Rhizobium bangladeshense]|uniref:lysozyme n=1 Tax=Rhizobium bangladeshense TaxID=1138189 RepID=UPI001A980B60|nr:glycoside hydrolase family protein [Rhizobium bangladeshense]QSY98668.1 glycoside hydrolase family protein [Rhizobium bangladeshense]
MPIGKIMSTKRGKAAAVGAILFAAVSGWNAFTGASATPAHPELTPQIVHAAVDKGLTPPAVQLAIDKLIEPWEGFSNIAYQDSVGVWTIGFGDTWFNGRRVRKGDYISREDAKKRLVQRATRDYYLPLVDGVKNYVQAPYPVQASLLSGGYNFGVGAARKSKAAGFVTAFKYDEACAAQTAFNKAGGKVLNGLVKRREMGDAQRLGEAELCLSWKETK